MSYKYIGFIVVILFGCLSVASLVLQRSNAEMFGEVELNLAVTRTTIHLGELLLIESELRNNSSAQVFFEDDPNHAISFKIAFKQDKDYKQYVPEGPYVSQEAYPDTAINPQESYKIRNTILWNRNFSSEIGSLSKEAADSYTKGKLTSDYAFEEAGVYFIKAVTHVVKNKQRLIVESKPVKVTVIEPSGEDLEVWNLLKRNGKIGYFLQMGDVPRTLQHKVEERDAILREIDWILEKYPTNLYLGILRRSRDNFRAKELQRQDFMRSAQRPEH